MILYGLLVAIVALIAMITFSTKQFVSPEYLFDIPAEFIEDAGPPPIFENAVQILSKALTFKTTTNVDPNEFKKTLNHLRESFPLVHQHFEIVNFDLGVLFKWKGHDESLDKFPIVFMSHMDTVPVPDENLKKWTHGPWSGDIADGYIYGRGSLDTKSTLVGSLNAAEELLKAKYVPKRTIYFAYGFDEEIVELEYGAKNISSYLEKQGVRPFFVMDEGGFMVKNLFTKMGIDGAVALIGVCEKQYLGVTLEVHCEGGHGSLPPKQTCIYQMSKGISRLIDRPMPAHASDDIFINFVDHVFPKAKLLYKVMFTIFKKIPFLADLLLSREKGMNGMLRTTFAPTIIQAGQTDNVLPKSAKTMLNIRVHPKDTVHEVIKHIRKVVSNDNIKISIVKQEGGPEVSEYRSIQYETLARSIQSVFSDEKNDVVHAPNLVFGTTDMKHYRKIAPTTSFNFGVYFIDNNLKDAERIHGVDERISVDNYLKMIHFFMTLIKNLEIVA